MGECTWVMMVFHDEVNVDSDVNLNVFEGEVSGNDRKQNYVYNLNWIT